MPRPPSYNALESIANTMVFGARDWGADDSDAWVYGVVCGWGEGIGEVAERHGWEACDVERLQHLHSQYQSLRGALKAIRNPREVSIRVIPPPKGGT